MWLSIVKLTTSSHCAPINEIVTRSMNSEPSHNLIFKTNTNIIGQIIQTFAQAKQLRKGKQLHAQLLVSAAHQSCVFISNHLLNLYSKCGELDYATKLFDKMPHRNFVSWTSMITGFCQNSMSYEAVETFSKMRVVGENPNQFTFSSVIKASVALGSGQVGKQLHCLCLKSGFNDDLFVGSNLADLYSKCGFMFDACKIFEEMPFKDEVSWTAMIDGYAKNGDFKQALIAFRNMINEEVGVDHYVLSSILVSCGGFNAYNLGKSIHAIVVKLAFEVELIVGNALMDMYSKLGDMESAWNVFKIDFKSKNVVSYTSLIDGYVETDQIDKALFVFLELRRNGIEPNEFTFSSLIKACANKAQLEQGIQLHAQVIKFRFNEDSFVSSILVDMYGKCGLLDHSIQVFDAVKNPTEITWNSLVSAFSQHGSGKAAITFFEQMICKGVKPDAITFVSLLTGCSHAGLIKEGMTYFESMEKIYGVKPKQEHYSCVIDLLSRAGKVKEAEEFINKMPFGPNAFGWCSYLGACRIQGNKEKAKFAAEKLLEIEPENTGGQVVLSNMYAINHQWEEVRRLRKMMKNGNMKKLPGYSWVDYGNKTHVFSVEDWSHPQHREIYEKLDCLLDQIKKAGYVANTDLIPFEMDQSMKEKKLHHHSERIAIAFALISLPMGKPIIVKKNIQVCVDCHSAIKFISRVVERKIIVRDNSRFHHFSDGSCSCGDYW